MGSRGGEVSHFGKWPRGLLGNMGADKPRAGQALHRRLDFWALAKTSTCLLLKWNLLRMKYLF